MIHFWELTLLLSALLFIIMIVIYLGYYAYINAQVYINRFSDVKSYKNISIIIPTYNEELVIKKKLDNMLEQSYPKELMELKVVDSNSNDNTVKIVKNFMESHTELNINLVTEKERKGKSHSINQAFSNVSEKTELVLMTDADSLLEKKAIENLVRCFNDEKVGAVNGIESILNIDESTFTQYEDTYKKYSKKLRVGESVIDSTPIFDGELSGYRKDIIQDMRIREDLNADDSQLAQIVRKKGYKSIMCPDAVWYRYAPSDLKSVRTQKIRRGQGLSRLFWYNKDMLFNRSYGKFGTMIYPANFFFHIISPLQVLLIIFFFSVSMVLLSLENVYILILSLSSLLTYMLFNKQLSKIKLFKTGITFVTYQLILLEAMFLHISGKSLHKWDKVDSIREKF